MALQDQYLPRNNGALAASRDQVIRHTGQNRCSVNLRHLIDDTEEDNRREEWDRKGEGVDYWLL